jgi:hypothetical protein
MTPLDQAKAVLTWLQLYPIPWGEVGRVWLTQAPFWAGQFAIVGAMAYVASHPFRKRTLLSKPICKLTGHAWTIERQCSFLSSEEEARIRKLHKHAGCRGTCDRCGEEWDDWTWRFEENQARIRRQTEEYQAALRNTGSAHAVARTEYDEAESDEERQEIVNEHLSRPATSAKKTRKRSKGKRGDRFDRLAAGDDSIAPSLTPAAEAPSVLPAPDPSAAEDPESPEGPRTSRSRS